MSHRRYEIHGTDDLGHVHSFHTCDRRRADEMLTLMRDDLDALQLTDRG